MEKNQKSYVDGMCEYHREINKQERKIVRENIINKKRGILLETTNSGEQTLKPEEVVTIANRITQKGIVCEEDLKLLSCAFIEGANNINAFLSVSGPLHALVRELTGVRSLTQLAAAECLVNLTLGCNKNCFKIAKASGPYLMTHLHGMNLNLKYTCIWVLGNLLDSDTKTWKLLNSQGVLSHLLHLLPVPELQENVLYSLAHYLKIGFSEIGSTDLIHMATCLIELKSCSSDVMWLLYLLSCSSYCDRIISQVIMVCFDILIDPDEYSLKAVTASVRILANISSEESGCYASIILSNFDKLLLICYRLIYSYVNYPHVIKELGWFISNLVNHQSYYVRMKVDLVIEKLQPLESEFESATISFS